METNNKTVEQACEVLYAYPRAEVCDGSGLTVLNNDKIADLILAAHKREIAAKDTDIASLRALVKDLSYALNASCECHSQCDGCDMADESKFDCPEKAFRALVAKAREMIGGAK